MFHVLKLGFHSPHRKPVCVIVCITVHGPDSQLIMAECVAHVT